MNINGIEICLPEPVRKRVRNSMDFSHSLSEEKWLSANLTGYVLVTLLLLRNRKHGKIRTALTAWTITHFAVQLFTAPEQIELAKKRIAEMRNKQAFDDIVGRDITGQN